MTKKPHYPPRQSAKPLLRPKLEQYIARHCMMSKTEFAKACNVTPGAVTQWLYTTRTPAQPVLRRIAKGFGLSYAEIMDLFETIEEVEQ